MQYQIDQLREFDKTVLSDYTKGLYGLGENGTADDIFQMLYETSFKGNSFMKVTVVGPTNQKLKDFSITITKSSGNITTKTNDQGSVLFLTKSNESVQISVSGSLADISGSLSTTASETGVKDVTMTCNFINYLLITSTKNIQFSPFVTSVEYALCGGGGGGGNGYGAYVTNSATSSGNGGGGGYTAHGKLDNIIPYNNYRATVGSGGGSNGQSGTVQNGSSGGESSFNGTSAKGGGGGGHTVVSHGLGTITSISNQTVGIGNGNGGLSGSPSVGQSYRGFFSGKSGENGTGTIYSSYTDEIRVGGGGGGGGTCWSSDNKGTANGGSKGTPNGGSGGSYTVSWTGDMENYSETGTPGTDGTGYGGGGGGGGHQSVGTYNAPAGGKGSAGCVTLRMHH